jgi:hypothetical protein
MPVTISGTTGIQSNLQGNVTGNITGNVTGDVNAQNITLNGNISDASNSPLLRQSGSTLALYHYTYSNQFTNTISQVYQVYHDETVVTLGNNSLFRLEADVFGYQVTTSGHRGNIGFEVVTPTGTTRIYGTDGSNGNSWQGFYYQGNVHRVAFWQSSSPIGTSLTFRLLVGSYESANACIWNYADYNSKAFFNITEIAS